MNPRRKTSRNMLKVLPVAILFLLTGCANTQKIEPSSSAASIPTSSAKSEANGTKVYFAGPLFNQAEKDFNVRVVTVLEEYGYDVFLPQRDGIEAALLEDKTEEELVDIIFPLDVSNVKNADVLFMNLDGRVPDEGACVELGIAYAEGKRCYGFKTDTRSAELTMELNPMITGCMTKIFKNFNGDGLIAEIRQYLTQYSL